jgi:hypothetical protein
VGVLKAGQTCAAQIDHETDGSYVLTGRLPGTVEIRGEGQNSIRSGGFPGQPQATEMLSLGAGQDHAIRYQVRILQIDLRLG